MIVVVVALAGWVIAQQPPAPPFRGAAFRSARIQWEYKALGRAAIAKLADERASDQFTEGLNHLGAEGWELVVVEASIYIFKRPAARRQPERRPQPEQRQSEAPATRIHALKHARAADVAKTLSAVLEDKAERFRLVSDQRTNSVLIRARPDEMREIVVLLEQLDVPVAQQRGIPAQQQGQPAK
jgi:type II secretory pathway component GspD/PulD (secretin)